MKPLTVILWLLLLSSGFRSEISRADEAGLSAQYKVLNIQAETARTLDFFNLQTARAYVDCFCVVTEQKSAEVEKLCQNRFKSQSLTISRMNTKGEQFAESLRCDKALNDLIGKTLTAHGRARLRMAVIEGSRHLGDFAYPIALEMRDNYAANPEMVIEPYLTSLVDLPAPWNQIEALTSNEIQKAVEHYGQESDRIHKKFLESSDYKSTFGTLGMDPNEVTEFLQGRRGNFVEKWQAAAREKRVADSPWVPLHNLETQFSRFAQGERIAWVRKRVQNLITEIDTLPIILYLPQATPSREDFFRALLQTEINAKDRYEKSLSDERRLVAAKNNRGDVVGEFAYLMDHELALQYIEGVAVNAKSWKQSDFMAGLQQVMEVRDRQIRVESRREMVMTFGALGLCFIPIPPLKALGVIAMSIKTNACFMGLGISVNSYFYLSSMKAQRRFLKELLSTPDGWNQLAKLNEVLEHQRSARLSLLFNLMEVIPAYSILKAVAPVVRR